MDVSAVWLVQLDNWVADVAMCLIMRKKWGWASSEAVCEYIGVTG